MRPDQPKENLNTMVKLLIRWSCGLLAAAALCTAAVTPAAAQNKTIKIGVLGVMRGPAASWGMVNKHAAETTAEMVNAQGGIEIGGEKYKVEVISIDDRLEPEAAVEGARRLMQDGVRYIIGPNVDTTAAVIVPLLRTGKAVNIAYGFAKYLYTPPQRNSILGMVASYQSAPAIYRYLIEKKQIRSVSFVARNEADSLNQRDEDVTAARGLGLVVVSSGIEYPPGTIDFKPVMRRMLSARDQGMLVGITGQLGGEVTPTGGATPDLVVLSGAAPGDTPLMLRALRELGYKGLVSTETAQDEKLLREAGDAAEGFISVGGATPPDKRSPYMQEFVKRYTQRAGDWNDEAGTKVYALEMILRTLQKAGPQAVDDTSVFLAALPAFAIDDPFITDKRTLRYVGASWFNHPRQIGVPMVIQEFRGGRFQTLFIASVE
jgi:branched-chain amino acid transport system substrate-binding protein